MDIKLTLRLGISPPRHAETTDRCGCRVPKSLSVVSPLLDCHLIKRTFMTLT